MQSYLATKVSLHVFVEVFVFLLSLLALLRDFRFVGMGVKGYDCPERVPSSGLIIYQ